MSLVSGIQYSTEIVGRRNAIINGDFDVWQRGTSHSTTGYGSADRWALWHDGSTTQSLSQQSFTVGQTDVPNSPTYYVNNVVTSGDLTNSVAEFYQLIESVHSFAGETITLSFWAKATVADKKLGVVFIQQFGTGGSPSSQVITDGDTLTLTTSWAKYTVTVTLPSISGKTLGSNNDDRLALGFIGDAGSASIYTTLASSIGNQDITYDIAQVQVEKGDTATDFEKRSIGEEKQLCYRYYWKRSADEGSNSRIAVGGNILSTTSMQIGVWLPVPMRDTPAVSHGTISSLVVYDGSLTNTVTAISAAEASREIFNLAVTTTGSTLTQFRVGQLTRSGTASDAWVAFDAEL